ncbi:uncharacterized protein METZ01_LOCUS55377 [marine metagenome]|uniref:Uncharacterized protein n=1 Tax=marine metagenome TaxID=408172 RepID=A0A381SMK3_9ZZZZ
MATARATASCTALGSVAARLECPAAAASSIRQATFPAWALQSLMLVGSPTITTSGVQDPSADRVSSRPWTPTQPISSS